MAILWRIIIAVVCVILALALLEPVASFLGLPLAGDALRILKICITGIAVLYVLAALPNPPWRRAG